MYARKLKLPLCVYPVNGTDVLLSFIGISIKQILSLRVLYRRYILESECLGKLEAKNRKQGCGSGKDPYSTELLDPLKICIQNTELVLDPDIKFPSNFIYKKV
jgi:hypothetical protein